MWSLYFFLGSAILALNTAVRHYSCPMAEYKSLMKMNKYIPNEKGCRDRDFSKEAKEMMMKGMCKDPRPMTVPIFSDDPSMQFVPSHVIVKRCQGLCFSNNRKACVASRSQEIKVPTHGGEGDWGSLWCGGEWTELGRLDGPYPSTPGASRDPSTHFPCPHQPPRRAPAEECIGHPSYCPIRRTNRGQNTECGYVVVEEHQSCMCGCAVSEEDCIPGKQKFNPGTCECECMNHKEKDMCTESGKEWNMNECTCDCPVQYMDCPHNKEWVPKFCECRKTERA